MIKIGDFSKLAQLSVKTLRYYDELGLLKPARVDRFTEYRYYSAEQLPRLNRILALKDLGLSLEQIGHLLNEGVSPAQLAGMLKLKQAEIQERVSEELERLARVAAWLRQIEQENKMSAYDVVIKKIAPQLVAAVRDTVPTPPEQGELWNELEAHVNHHKAKPTGACFTIYHDPEYKERDWDVEVCEPLAASIAGSQRVRVYELPGVETMACSVHHGPFVTINQAYQQIMKWIESNGYRVAGPCREVYLRTAEHGSQTDPNTVTEIQFPVEKT